MKPLFEHQKKSVAALANMEYALDASDPGVGKTRTQIEAYVQRRKVGGGKALVVAPRSLLRSAWQQDFATFAPWIRVSVGTADKRDKAFAMDADVYVINTDGVTWLAKQKPEFFKDFDTLIIDEISSFKHHTSQRSKAINKIKNHFRYRYGLTGTPDSNTIADLWHPIYILDNGRRLGTSFYHFRQSVCTPQQTGPGPAMVKWVDRPQAEHAVGTLLADMTIRHKFEDCIDIPPNYQYPIPYFMSPKQEKVYKDMAKNAMVQLNSGQIVSTVNAAGLTTKLLQIASGAVYNEDGTYSLIDTYIPAGHSSRRKPMSSAVVPSSNDITTLLPRGKPTKRYTPMSLNFIS